MALSSIVQDIGADRGFLLSENGFQSGAIRVSSRTNITLTSLEDLTSSTQDSIRDATIGGLHWRIHKAKERLRKIKKDFYDDDYIPPTTSIMATLWVLESALDDALSGQFPIVYAIQSDDRPAARTLDELIKVANDAILEAENWIPPG